jgi:Fe-S-cluster-containing dehydrogenase component/CRP-like cAMP-binding protein
VSSLEFRRSAEDVRLFDAPLLKVLDERARGELRASGAVRSFEPGDVLYREGDVADTFWVVLEGTVALSAPEGARGGARIIRHARGFGTFGEEASELGAQRISRAIAETSGRAFEISMTSYRRALVRLGKEAVLDREVRAFQRADLHDRLRVLGLAERRRTLELLLDTGRLLRPEPGAFCVVAGERAGFGFLVLEGEVELLSAGERPRVTAYVAPGDVFAHREAVSGASHSRSAVPLGSALLLELMPGTLLELESLDPEWVRRVDRHGGVAAELGVWLDRSQQRRTRLALAELPRLAEARSLLSIDLDNCVRCGHCASGCASAHGGVSRLERSGAKVASAGKDGERSLLLPNSCHHCRRPSCLPECPTGAIGRGPDGEVFIREQLCTGCGACERACPWNNIQLVPRADGRTVATKCDLCSGAVTPACVAACPTDAITRGPPELSFGELERLKGAEKRPGPVAVRSSAALHAGFALLAAALFVLSLNAPPARAGSATGAVAGLLTLALLAHGVRKRLSRRGPLGTALGLHRALGLLAPAAVVAHGGLAWGAGVPGALSATFWGSMFLGLATALAYRVLPRRLTRLEREVVSSERGDERARLEDRLHLAISTSGRSARTVFEHLLVPYLRSPLVPLSLLASGRSLADEERRLVDRVRSALSEHEGAELRNLDGLISAAVELAARPARGVIAGTLRALGLLHLILGAVLLVLLTVHVVGVVL